MCAFFTTMHAIPCSNFEGQPRAMSRFAVSDTHSHTFCIVYCIRMFGWVAGYILHGPEWTETHSSCTAQTRFSIKYHCICVHLRDAFFSMRIIWCGTLQNLWIVVKNGAFPSIHLSLNLQCHVIWHKKQEAKYLVAFQKPLIINSICQ